MTPFLQQVTTDESTRIIFLLPDASGLTKSCSNYKLESLITLPPLSSKEVDKEVY